MQILLVILQIDILLVCFFLLNTWGKDHEKVVTFYFSKSFNLCTYVITCILRKCDCVQRMSSEVKAHLTGRVFNKLYKNPTPLNLHFGFGFNCVTLRFQVAVKHPCHIKVNTLKQRNFLTAQSQSIVSGVIVCSNAKWPI